MNPQRLILATVALAVVVVAAIVIVPRLGGGASAAGSDLALDSQPRTGPSDAQVQLVFFEDFLCPHCATFSETVTPRIERQYVDDGRASIHFVNFVVMGPESERIASVGECVAEQGDASFWAFEEVAFRSQSGLTESGAIDLANEYVSDLDGEALQACLDDGRGLEAVRADNARAQELGLGGTPSVLVDGQEVSATYDAVARAIDRAVAE